MKFNFTNGNRTRIRRLFASRGVCTNKRRYRNTVLPAAIAASWVSSGVGPVEPNRLCAAPIGIALPFRLWHRSIITYAWQLGNGRGQRGGRVAREAGRVGGEFSGSKGGGGAGRGRETKLSRPRSIVGRQTNPRCAMVAAAWRDRLRVWHSYSAPRATGRAAASAFPRRRTQTS